MPLFLFFCDNALFFHIIFNGLCSITIPAHCNYFFDLSLAQLLAIYPLEFIKSTI